MKNPKKVERLLEELLKESENQFEVNRIKSLYEDLMNGAPKVEIIDENTQRFKGRNYKKNYRGYYDRKEYLHITVFEYCIGQVRPDGYDVHHKNNNKEDNNINNLQLEEKSNHSRIHMLQKHNENKISRKKFKTFCTNCGAEIEVYDNGRKNGNHFCKNGKCYNEWKSKNSHITRICEDCGKSFEAFKYENATRCRSCRGKIAQQKNLKIVKCEICGQEFKAVKYMNHTKCRKCRRIKR